MGAFLSGVDRSCALIAISHSQRRLGAGLPWSATIYHGLAYKGPEKQEPATGPALWLARFNPDKGPDLAMQACTKAGIEVVLAGKATEDVEKRYLEEVIRPMSADHPCAKLVVNPDRKLCQELMMQARCLLLPVCWEEPFGMVLLEAMTTGTPVVALSRGAIPEVVVHGQTGYVCDTPDQLPDALQQVSTLDPAVSINHVRENFSAEAMARRYEAVYHRWAATGSSARARHTLSPVSTFASSQRVA
jgi:glycosyltransferase involved in cell wall biosynthesis